MDLYEGFVAKNVWGPKMTLRKPKFIENSLKLASNVQTNQVWMSNTIQIYKDLI